MGNYFTKVGRLSQAVVFLAILTFSTSLVSIGLNTPTVQAASPTGTGSIIVHLSQNPSFAAKVTATRAAQALDVANNPVKGTPETVTLTEETGPKIKDRQTYISPVLQYSGVSPSPTACGTGTSNPENDSWYNWNIQVSGSATGIASTTVNCGKTVIVNVNVTLAGIKPTTGTIAGTATATTQNWACTPNSKYYLTAPGTAADTSTGGTALPSDSNGKFSFTANPGNYDFTVDCLYSANGENSLTEAILKKQNITVTAGKTTTINLTDDSSTTCASTDSNGNCTNTADDSLDCGAGGWNWIICSGIQLLQSGADKLDSLITSQLNVDTGKIFANGDTTKAYKTAWNSFRIIAIAVLVIAGLIMVTSQALGFEFLDAYTIRKVLPRLLIAIIGISISWPILQFVINFFDVVGYDVRELIYAPFNAMAKSGGISTLVLLGNPLTLVAAGTALFSVYGMSVFTFLLTGFLALMVAFLVLVIRQIAIIILVIMAPLAIACYILPNTQKVWKLWTDNFMGLMLMFPIVSALIAAGHVMSAVGRQGGAFEQFVSIIAYFAPYFMLPFAFRLATGAISTIAGLVNDRSRGAFDRLRNARNNAARLRHQMRASGQAKLLGSDRLSSLYRRASLISTPNSGALSMTQRGRERFRSHEQILAIRTADEALKNDGGRSTGNDEATALAVREGMTRRQFIREYAVNGRTEAEAERALAQLETGLGVQIGTGAMRVAAFKARAASSTAYSGNEAGTLQRINEGGALINAGLLTSTDTTAAGKGNRGRLDINGNGFGAQMTAFDAAAASLRAGGPGMTHAQAEAYLDETLGSADPGDLLAGNNRTVTAMAPAMIRRLKRELARATTTNVDGSVTVDVTHEGLNRSLGQIAGVQDNLNRTSPDKAALFDNLVNGQLVNGDTGGTELTVMQMVNNAATRPPDARGIQAFLEVRKEYGSARAAAAAGATGAPPEPEEH